MDATTIKVSVQTRDRIKARGGATHEATIVEALDALDRADDDEFWAQAEAAAAWRRSLPPAERARRETSRRELDAAFDAIS
jgi:hypothetical protein